MPALWGEVLHQRRDSRSQSTDRLPNMKTKLITALRTAASAIEAGTFNYRWDRTAQCNCGSLFCALTGKSAAELTVPPALVKEKDYGPTWTVLVGQYCPITGMPTQALFKELFSYGLTQQDIVNLEYLNDPKVKARMNFHALVGNEPPPELPKRKWYQWRKPATAQQKLKLYYNNKHHVAAYMRAWADLLQEEGAQDVATKTEQHTHEEPTR